MSATINIRPGTILDLPGCHTLINSLTVSEAVDEKLGFLLSRTTEEDLSQIFLNEITFVALDNEHTVGFASAFRAGSQHYEKFRRELVAVGKFAANHYEVLFATEALGAWQFELGIALSRPARLPEFLRELEDTFSPQLLDLTVLSEIEDLKWSMGSFLAEF